MPHLIQVFILIFLFVAVGALLLLVTAMFGQDFRNWKDATQRTLHDWVALFATSFVLIVFLAIFTLLGLSLVSGLVGAF